MLHFAMQVLKLEKKEEGCWLYDQRGIIGATGYAGGELVRILMGT